MGGFSNAIFEVEPNTKYCICYLLSRLPMITTGDQSARNGDSSTYGRTCYLSEKHTTHLVVSDVQPPTDMVFW